MSCLRKSRAPTLLPSKSLVSEAGLQRIALAQSINGRPEPRGRIERGGRTEKGHRVCFAAAEIVLSHFASDVNIFLRMGRSYECIDPAGH